MFNITDCIAAIRDAETIHTSPLIENDERPLLMAALSALIPPAWNRPYADTTKAIIERLYERPVPTPVEEARPTEGEQDAAPVAPHLGAAEQAAEARPTEGLQEQAKDPGVVRGPSPVRDTPTEARSSSKRRKQAARK